MTSDVVQTMDFDGLSISYDDRVLRPRQWTAAQSRWAADLLAEVPDGPVLELCSGAGQIGLAAVARTDRDLVCVDLCPRAVDLTGINAKAAGMERRVTARKGRLTDAVRDHEQFPLVIADPPWVETSAIGRYPEDPLLAIDGGRDGLSVARECLDVIDTHLAPGGAALLQLGSVDQVAALMSLGSGSLRCLEVRRYDGGAVAHLVRADQD